MATLPLSAGDGIDALEDGVADFGHRGVGVDGPGQGRHARHVRRGHARARIGRVAVAGNGAVDRDARRGDVDGRGPVATEARQTVVLIGGGHGDHVGGGVVGRILGRSVVVGAAVAGGGDEEDAGVAGGLDGAVASPR